MDFNAVDIVTQEESLYVLNINIIVEKIREFTGIIVSFY